MRRYNDGLIFILANLLGSPGPRREPRRRPCRRAKCADPAAGVTRKISQEAPRVPGRRNRLRGRSKRRARAALWHKRGGAAPPRDRWMARLRRKRRGGGRVPKHRAALRAGSLERFPESTEYRIARRLRSHGRASVRY